MSVSSSPSASVYMMSSHRHHPLGKGGMSVAIVFMEFCCYECGWLGLAFALDDDSLFLLEGYWG